MKFSVIKILIIFIVFFSFDSFAQDRASKIRKVEETILSTYNKTEFEGVKSILFRRSVYLVSVVKLPPNSSGDLFRLATVKSDRQVIEFLNPSSTSSKTNLKLQETEVGTLNNGEKVNSNTEYSRTMVDESVKNSNGLTNGFGLLTVPDKDNQKIYIFYKKTSK